MNRKEKCLAIEAAVGRLEGEVDAITKRMQKTIVKIEQAANTLKQVVYNLSISRTASSSIIHLKFKCRSS